MEQSTKPKMATGCNFSGDEMDLLISEIDPLFAQETNEHRSKRASGSAAAEMRLMLNDDDDGRGEDKSESGSSLLLTEEEIHRNSCDSMPVNGDRRRLHDHCHSTVMDDQLARNKLIAVSGLCFVFMVAEIIGGLIANSLAIVSDASHLACDLAGFLVSLFAIWIAKKPPTQKMSFGYHRAEVLGALVSVLIIWVITIILVYLGVKRIIDNEYEVYGETMLITACIGVAFNILMGVVLHSGIASCNIKSSFGHGHSHEHGHSHGSHHHVDNYSHGGSHGHSHSGSHDHHHDHSHSRSLEHKLVSGQSASSGSNQVHFHGNLVHNSIGVWQESSAALLPSNNNEDYHMPALDNNNQSEPWSSSQSLSDNHIDCDDDEKLIDVIEDRPPSPALHVSSGADSFDFKQDKRMNINVRAALVHVIGDLVQSIGVLIAAIIINYKPAYRIADPICTFIFSFLVLCTTISILKDVVSVIMEAVPSGVNYRLMKADLKNISGVMTVHSLNVWALTLDRMAVNVHLGVAVLSNEWQDILATATMLLREKHKMFQSTIQVELYEETMESCHHCHSD